MFVAIKKNYGKMQVIQKPEEGAVRLNGLS